MKVSGNKVKHLVELYFSELNLIYSESETEAILNSAFNHFTGYNRTEVILRQEENVNESDLLKLYKCCEDLKSGKPLQYILNSAWFYNINFFVNEHVLIPRPETEELVELIIKENPHCKSLLDMGCGSGCIAVSIAANLSKCKIYACDINEKALHVSAINAKKNNVSLNLFKADILHSIDFSNLPIKNFDVIVSNPPYVLLSEKNSLDKNVKNFEPHSALFVGGKDPILFYKNILEYSEILLNNKGRLYFELNPKTAEKVKEIAVSGNLFSSVELITDMSGHIRFLKAVKK